MVVSIDYKNSDGELKNAIVIMEKEKKYSPLEWVSKVENGAGEILLTNIDNEGSMSGYDLDLAKIITNKINIPLMWFWRSREQFTCIRTFF